MSVLLRNNITMCKTYTKLYPGSTLNFLQILTSEDIDDVISHFHKANKVHRQVLSKQYKEHYFTHLLHAFVNYIVSMTATSCTGTHRNE